MLFLTWLLSLFRLTPPELKLSTEDTRFSGMDATDDADERLARAGQLAVEEARRLYSQDVVDPPFGDKRPEAKRWLAVISSIIRAAGWGWALPYLGNRKDATQWCGMFAATCWKAAGINPTMLATFWASTKRLFAWGSYRPWNGTPNPAPKGPHRRLMCDLRKKKVLTFAPRAGDVLVIGDGDPIEGDHICLVIAYDEASKTFETIEGNGRGLGPDGQPREGIVLGTRAMAKAMFLYRPGIDDLLATLD